MLWRSFLFFWTIFFIYKIIATSFGKECVFILYVFFTVFNQLLNIFDSNIRYLQIALSSILKMILCFVVCFGKLGTPGNGSKAFFIAINRKVTGFSNERISNVWLLYPLQFFCIYIGTISNEEAFTLTRPNQSTFLFSLKLEGERVFFILGPKLNIFLLKLSRVLGTQTSSDIHSKIFLLLRKSITIYNETKHNTDVNELT